MHASIRPWFLALPLLFACTTDETEALDTDGASSSDPTTDDPGPLDPMCEPNAGDGSTQCGGNICPGGERCQNSAAGVCEVGCESTLNCPTGQWCDLRMPDAWGAGLCRPTSDPACGTEPAGTTADEVVECLDVQGNYTLHLSEDAPEVCTFVFEEDLDCSVAQEGCTLRWGCGEDQVAVFPPGTIDANDDVEVEGTYQGIPYTCTFDFTHYPGSWSCAFASDEGAAVCDGWFGA